MRIAVAYYLLFFYAVALFKPVLPFVSDFVAHAFYSKQHVATVHTHQGAAHAHRDAALAFSDRQDEQKGTTVQFSEPVSVHVVLQQQLYNFSLRSENTPFHFMYFFSISKPCLDVPFPPPKYSLA